LFGAGDVSQGRAWSPYGLFERGLDSFERYLSRW